MSILANASFSVGEFLLWCLWVFLFVIWIWLIITTFSDIFRRHDINGWIKTLWIVFVIVLPYLGIFVYLISQSQGMAERNMKQVELEREQLRQFVSTGSAADELVKIDQLKSEGKLTDDEYQRLRAKVIG